MKKRFLRKAMTMFLAVALVFTGLPMNFVIAEDGGTSNGAPVLNSVSAGDGSGENGLNNGTGNNSSNNNGSSNSNGNNENNGIGNNSSNSNSNNENNGNGNNNENNGNGNNNGNNNGEGFVGMGRKMPTSNLVIENAQKADVFVVINRGDQVIKKLLSGNFTNTDLLNKGDRVKAFVIDKDPTFEIGWAVQITSNTPSKQPYTRNGAQPFGLEGVESQSIPNDVHDFKIATYPVGNDPADSAFGQSVTINSAKESEVQLSVDVDDAAGNNVLMSAVNEMSDTKKLPVGLPVKLSAKSTTGLAFDHWNNARGEVIRVNGLPLPATATFIIDGSNNVFTPVFKNRHDTNLEKDVLYKTIDVANQNKLNVKHYQIRTKSSSYEDQLKIVKATLKASKQDIDGVELQKDGYFGGSQTDRTTLFGKEKYTGFKLQEPLTSNEFAPTEAGSLYWEKHDSNFSNVGSLDQSNSPYYQAVQIWGNFVPRPIDDQTHQYKLRVWSDDGAYGTVTTKDGAITIADKWSYHSADSNNASDKSFTAEPGQIFPLNVEYFENRYNDAVFRLQMSVDNTAYVDIPREYLYPSSGMNNMFAVDPIVFDVYKDATVNDPILKLNGPFIVKGKAEPFTNLKVTITSNDLAPIVKSVATDAEGKWSITDLNVSAFEDGKVTITSEYTNITSTEGPKVQSYDYEKPYNFIINSDDTYSIYLDDENAALRGVTSSAFKNYTTDWATSGSKVEKYTIGTGTKILYVSVRDEGTIGGLIASMQKGDTWLSTGVANNRWQYYDNSTRTWKFPTVVKDPKNYWSSFSAGYEKYFGSASKHPGNWVWDPSKTAPNYSSGTTVFRLVVGDYTPVATAVTLQAIDKQQSPESKLDLQRDEYHGLDFLSLDVPLWDQTRLIEFKPTVYDQYGFEMSNANAVVKLKKATWSWVWNYSESSYDGFASGMLTLDSFSKQLDSKLDSYYYVIAYVNNLSSDAIELEVDKETPKASRLAWMKNEANLKDLKKSDFIKVENGKAVDKITIEPAGGSKAYKAYLVDQYGLPYVKNSAFKEAGYTLTAIPSISSITFNNNNSHELRYGKNLVNSVATVAAASTGYSPANLVVTLERAPSVATTILWNASTLDSSGKPVSILTNDTVREFTLDVPKLGEFDKSVKFQGVVLDQYGEQMPEASIEYTGSLLAAGQDRFTLTKESQGGTYIISAKVGSLTSNAPITVRVNRERSYVKTLEISGPENGVINVPTWEQVRSSNNKTIFRVVKAEDQYGVSLLDNVALMNSIHFGTVTPLPNGSGISWIDSKGTLALTEKVANAFKFEVVATSEHPEQGSPATTKSNVIPITTQKEAPKATYTRFINPDLSVDVPVWSSDNQQPKTQSYTAKVYDQYNNALENLPVNVVADSNTLPANVTFANNQLKVNYNSEATKETRIALRAPYEGVTNENTGSALVQITKEPSRVKQYSFYYQLVGTTNWVEVPRKDNEDGPFVTLFIPGYDKVTGAAGEASYVVKAVGLDQYHAEKVVVPSNNTEGNPYGYSSKTGSFKLISTHKEGILKLKSGKDNRQIKIQRSESAATFVEWDKAPVGPLMVTGINNPQKPLQFTAVVKDQYMKPMDLASYKAVVKLAGTYDKLNLASDGFLSADPKAPEYPVVTLSASYTSSDGKTVVVASQNKTIAVKRMPVKLASLVMPEDVTKELQVGTSAGYTFGYSLLSQFGDDITRTSEYANNVTLMAQLVGDKEELLPLPAGLTVSTTKFTTPSNLSEAVESITITAATTLPEKSYKVKITGTWMQPIPDAAFKMAVERDKSGPGKPIFDEQQLPVQDDMVVTLVVKAAPITPPTPPTPQPQTRGERGDRGATFANVIITDELTPLGAVKFNNAYMVGYPNRTFKPTAVMTRGEAAAVFANVLGLNKNLKTGVNFTDVSTKNWNYGAIQASVKVGLLTTKDGKFNPDAPVTRADMAVAFAKFWELNSIKVSDAATKTTDIAGHWAEKQINQTINAKLMAAFDDNSFKPDSAVTREQTAVMFNKLIARAKIAKTKPSFKDVSLDYWAAGDIEAAVMKMNILGK